MATIGGVSELPKRTLYFKRLPEHCHDKEDSMLTLVDEFAGYGSKGALGISTPVKFKESFGPFTVALEGLKIQPDF